MAGLPTGSAFDIDKNVIDVLRPIVSKVGVALLEMRRKKC